MATVRCVDCEFFDWLDETNGIGDCRRYAPRGRALDDDETYIWSKVYAEDFCGDFSDYTGKFVAKRNG